MRKCKLTYSDRKVTSGAWDVRGGGTHRESKGDSGDILEVELTGFDDLLDRVV